MRLANKHIIFWGCLLLIMACMPTRVYACSTPLNLFDFTTGDGPCGGEEVTMSVYVFSGTYPYTYNWSNNDTGSSISVTVSGYYDVTVTDVNGCTGAMSYYADVNPNPIVADLQVDSFSCVDGYSYFSINTSGGHPSYSYMWSSGSKPVGSPAIRRTNTSGTHSVTVSDAYGCAVAKTIYVDVPEWFTSLDIVGETQLCVNPTTLDAQPLDGEETFDYIWSNGEVTKTISTHTVGDYTVTVTDNAGCTQTKTVTVAERPPFTAVYESDNTSCAGAADGALTFINLQGASRSAASFNWTGPDAYTSTNQDLTALKAGSYTVAMTDVNGCSGESTVTVSDGAPITLNYAQQNANCAGGDDGSLTLNSVSGNSAAITNYSWTGANGYAANSADINQLLAGSYTITVEDGAGCTGSNTYTIQEGTPILINHTAQDVNCAGGNNGSISFDNVSNVTAQPLTYSWSGPNGYSATAQSISNVTGGNYTITVTDANGCTGTNTYTIDELNDSILLSSTIQSVSCKGNDGRINLSLQNGTSPFTYSWTGPNGFSSTIEDPKDLLAGTYHVTTTDANGCSNAVQNIEVNYQLDSLQINEQLKNVTCAGGNDASIKITVTNAGIANVTYNWSGPNGYTATSNDITGLSSGTYNLTLQNDIGCTATSSYDIIHENEIPALNTSSNNATCAGNDGNASVTVQSGSAPFDYTWTNENNQVVSTAAMLSNAAAGDYTLAVSGQFGCTSTTSVTIGQTIGTLQLNTSAFNVECEGTAEGSINLTVANGGNTSLTYSWEGPNGFTAAAEGINQLEAGTYNVTVQNDLGCQGTTSVSLIYVIDTIELSALVINDICAGGTGKINLSLSNGSTVSSLNWAGPNGFTSTSEDLNNIEEGTYTVAVEDNNGCLSEDSYTVVNHCPNNPTDIESNVSTGRANNTNLVTQKPTSATPPKQYSITIFDNSGQRVGYKVMNEDSAPVRAKDLDLEPGTYQYQFMDENGRIINGTITLQ